MKIVKIEVITIAVPRLVSGEVKPHQWQPLFTARYGFHDEVIAKVYTDEGIVGLGEVPTISPETRETTDETLVFVREYLGPRLLGQDPFEVEKVWEIMEEVAYGGTSSKTLIDMALYDIRARALKIPVCKLLGGLYKERFPVTLTIGWDTPEQMAKRARELVDTGYQTLRLKVGQSLKTDLQMLKSIREQIGDDINLRVDADGGWSVPKAITSINAMEKYSLEFVEQPVTWYDFKGMAEVARKVAVPLAAHEGMYTLQDVDNLIKLGGTDILGVKAYRPGGGLTSTMKVLAMADIMNIPCYVHSASEAGVCTAASAHLIAAQYRHLDYTNEMTGLVGYASQLVKNPVKIEGGFAEVPKGPGLGVELDEEAVKKFTREIAVIK